MEPVVITCSGCRVRIRIAKPLAAMDRACPRCSASLRPALTEALSEVAAHALDPVDLPDLGINLGGAESPDDPPSDTVESSNRTSPNLALLVAAASVLVGSALALSYWWITSPQTSRPDQANIAVESTGPSAATPISSEPVAEAEPAILPDSSEVVSAEQPEPPLRDGTRENSGNDTNSTPDPLASLREPGGIPPTSPISQARNESAPGAPSDSPPPAPTPDPVDEAPTVAMRTASPSTPPVPSPDSATSTDADTTALSQAKRVRIRTETGETVVGRVHGESDGQFGVMLPNGQLGFTDGLAETEEPFQPATMAEMKQKLTQSGPFKNYRVLESEHYLVLYQSSTPFAEASIHLLEDLYKNLISAFRKRELPATDAEFPLVAIIFRTESEFRAHQKVPEDVQAYYEILSNRIYLYEKSEHDQQSPEVAALRKPQTVAHEGTHQILQNIGIHPRLAAWPLWLVEGFAEYCSPPAMTRRGAAWGGLGQVNALHMATMHDLNDPAAQLVRGERRQKIGRDPKKPLIEYLVTRTSLTPTDYALSWALTHYLAQKRGTEFLDFIRTMSQLKPMEERTPEQQLESFQAAFGTDLPKMDKAVATHLAKLKYDPLPFYAVVFEQPIPGNQLRRATIVSQSPSMIRQWLSEISDVNGGLPSWEAYPHPSRSRAQLAAEQWMRSR